MSDSSIAVTARRQHGLVTRSQALEVISAGSLERRVRARRLEPVRRGVYRVGGAPETWEQHLLAVCLAAGPTARASFRAAAALHRLDGFAPDVLEVTVFGDRAAEIDGVAIHESTIFDLRHFAEVDGVPTTSMARTLCDLTAVVPTGPSSRQSTKPSAARQSGSGRWLTSRRRSITRVVDAAP